MLITIITINYNNASGLFKTIESVVNQTSREFEYIIVDGTAPQPPEGGAEDREVIDQFVNESKEIINGFTQCTWNSPHGVVEGGFYSESDKGIYHAMNKGIAMAKGEYVQFLNSGDVLASVDVTAKMVEVLKSKEQRAKSKDNRTKSQEPRQDFDDEGVNILYGNMIKPYKGKIIKDRGFAGRQATMLDFYTGTLNHSPAYIRRSLFEKYGLYDENLKIVSDWKWYLQVIALNNVQPIYTDIDVTVFDMNGISTVNSGLDKAERRKVLTELLSLSVLADYDRWAKSIDQLKRINSYWLTRKGFWLVERMLFKWEKRNANVGMR